MQKNKIIFLLFGSLCVISFLLYYTSKSSQLSVTQPTRHNEDKTVDQEADNSYEDTTANHILNKVSMEYYLNITRLKDWRLNVSYQATKDFSMYTTWNPLKNYLTNDTHELAILVPYSSARVQMLPMFITYMTRWLMDHGRNFVIYLLDQVDGKPFNRGVLINVGYLIGKEEGCDYFISHDLDRFPVKWNNTYEYPSWTTQSVQMDRLMYRHFAGAVFMFKGEMFAKVNGFSNKLWGWGGEDDLLGLRINRLGSGITALPAKRGGYLPDSPSYIHLNHKGGKKGKGNKYHSNNVKVLKAESANLTLIEYDGVKQTDYEYELIRYPTFAHVKVMIKHVLPF